MSVYAVTMRTVIDVPQEVIVSLDSVSAEENRSRASVIREALAEYVARKQEPSAQAAFGLWSDRNVDGLKYQETIRGEWEREA